MKAVRQKKLIKLLNTAEMMTIRELAERLSVSKMTIRRDLEEMEQQRVIRRLHGGAVLLSQPDAPDPYDALLSVQREAKQRIGKAAAAMVQRGSIVCFDAGTTPLAAAQNIVSSQKFTAITLGLVTAQTLCRNEQVDVVHIGGEIHHPTYSSCGSMACELLTKLQADMAFISAKAVDVSAGTYERLGPLSEPRKALVSIAKKIVLLADHTKFEARSLCLSIPISEIHCVVTDTDTNPQHIEQLRSMGKQVLVV